VPAAADPGPSSSLSPGPRARFPSASDRGHGQPASSRRPPRGRRGQGLTDGRSRPRDRSVRRARALTGAARSGCGRPGGESSGHHQTERLAGLDRGRAERVVDRGLLALPSDSVSEGAGPTIRLRRRKVGFPVGASTFRHKIGRQKHGRLSCHGQAGHSLGHSPCHNSAGQGHTRWTTPLT
jgi:hypothetical protein